MLGIPRMDIDNNGKVMFLLRTFYKMGFLNNAYMMKMKLESMNELDVWPTGPWSPRVSKSTCATLDSFLQ